MIRHILLFSFRTDADEKERQLLLDELRRLPEQFRAIKNFELGKNASRRDAGYEYGMTASFDTVSDLESYLTSERHEHFVGDRFRPLVSGRTIVSFEV